MNKKNSKKGKILKMFDELEWLSHISGGRCKIIGGEDLEKAGLHQTWEYGEKYNDIVYLLRIFKKMGYMAVVGHSIYITEKN